PALWNKGSHRALPALERHENIGQLGRNATQRGGGLLCRQPVLIELDSASTQGGRCLLLLQPNLFQLIQVRAQSLRVYSALFGERVVILGTGAASSFHRGGRALDGLDHAASSAFDLL